MLPDRFRLAVYLPGQSRLFVTDAVERQGLYDTFQVDLTADGAGRLRRTSSVRYWTLGGVAVALPLTLAIEAAVILLYTRLRRLPLRPLLTAGLVVNALTLPGVWIFSGLTAAIVGPGAGVTALAVTEVIAWAGEGAVYASWGRLGLGAAFLLSLIANAASFGLGLFVH